MTFSPPLSFLILLPFLPLSLSLLQVSTSFFTFQVQRNLKQAKSFLSLMGYEQVQNTTDFTLKRFSIEQVYLLVTDIVILHEDLEIISFLISRTAQWSRDLANAKIKFCHFFLARRYGPADKLECLDFIMEGKAARCPLPPPSSSSSSPYSPSTSSTSSPTSQRYNRGNDQPYDSRVEERTRYEGSYSDDTRHNYPYNDEKGRLPSRNEYGYNDTGFDNRRDQYYGLERQRDQYYGGRYDQQRDTGYYANYQRSDYYGGQYQDAHYDQRRGYEHDRYPRDNYDDNYRGRDTYHNPQRWEEQRGDYRDDRWGGDYHRDEPRHYEGQRPPRDVNCDGRDGRYEDERTVRPVETNYEPESSFTSNVGDSMINMPGPVFDAKQMKNMFGRQSSTPQKSNSDDQSHSFSHTPREKSSNEIGSRFDRRHSSTPSFGETSFSRNMYDVHASFDDPTSPRTNKEPVHFTIAEENDEERGDKEMGGYQDNGAYYQPQPSHYLPRGYDDDSYNSLPHPRENSQPITRRGSEDGILSSAKPRRNNHVPPPHHAPPLLHSPFSKTWGGSKQEGENIREQIRRNSSKDDTDLKTSHDWSHGYHETEGGIEYVASDGSLQERRRAAWGQHYSQSWMCNFCSNDNKATSNTCEACQQPRASY